MTDFVRSNRRDFLLDTTRGLGGVALGAMLADAGIPRAAPTPSVPDASRVELHSTFLLLKKNIRSPSIFKNLKI